LLAIFAIYSRRNVRHSRIFCSAREWMKRNRLPPAKRSENPSLIAFWYGLLADSAPRKWVSPGRATVSHR